MLYSWVFLGAAVYFGSSLIRPLWANGRGQLMGFLAYDLVLIGPFLRHFGKVDPALWINLVVYTTVLASRRSGRLLLSVHPPGDAHDSAGLAIAVSDRGPAVA